MKLNYSIALVAEYIYCCNDYYELNIKTRRFERYQYYIQTTVSLSNY